MSKSSCDEKQLRGELAMRQTHLGANTGRVESTMIRMHVDVLYPRGDYLLGLTLITRWNTLVGRGVMFLPPPPPFLGRGENPGTLWPTSAVAHIFQQNQP